MNILIKNCNLISMSEKRNRYEENVDIYIEHGEIKNIAKDISPKNDKDVKIIDGKNRVIIPGLINTHAHIPMSIFRETLDGYKLQEWLEKKIWPMEDKLTEEDIYYATILSGIEMIKTGTTTINDMYFFEDSIIKASLELGIRLQTTRTLMNISNDGEKRLEELERIIEKYNNKYETLTLNVGIHGLYTSDNDYIQKCIEVAKKYELPIHMHFCENSKEIEDIKRIYGKEPIQILKEYFGGSHTILAHALRLTTKDIKEIDRMNVHISHCPISNLKLGCGIAKIKQMIDSNINISLGTDGQGSGSNLDMFETMKYTALLQKGINEDPAIMPAYEILQMATINGAKALGLESKTGSIEKGKKADILILNVETEVMQPINNIFADIVYNAKGINVETTIINGKIVMENRKIKGIDENKIYQKCKEIINRISE